MTEQKENIIVDLSFQFALDVIRFAEDLERLRKFSVSNQLFRSSTSVGANIREAQHAESKADFIHKMKLAAKELEESVYWLQLCASLPQYPDSTALLEQATSIGKVLSKIIGTSKRSLQSKEIQPQRTDTSGDNHQYIDSSAHRHINPSSH
jgi:four helix bundle protein